MNPARLAVVCAALAVTALARAAGPSPGDRSIAVGTRVPARLTLTVTDHGAACGLAADSTATWVLRGEHDGQPFVVCARNDRASQIRFPPCDPFTGEPKRRCVFATGGLQGLSQSGLAQLAAQIPQWLEYKIDPHEIAEAVLGSSTLTTTIVGDACERPRVDGKPASCSSDADCNLGTCQGSLCSFSGDAPCGTDGDCLLGACVLDHPVLLGCARRPDVGCAQDADCNGGSCDGGACSVVPSASCATDSDCLLGACLSPTAVATGRPVGSRAELTVTLGFTSAAGDQGACGVCARDSTVACLSADACRRTCSFGQCDTSSTPSCGSDADCDFGPCTGFCDNDPTVACTSPADCNLVINMGNAEVRAGAACTLVQCGDGFVDPTEQCDDGPLNGSAQSSCGCDCMFPSTSGTTTSTSITGMPATTTTTLACPRGGLAGVLCALERVSPQEVCASDSIDPVLAQVIGVRQARIAALARRAAAAGQAGKRGRAQRLQRAAGRQLSALRALVDRAAKPRRRRPPRVAASCRQALDAQVDAARTELDGLLT